MSKPNVQLNQPLLEETADGSIEPAIFEIQDKKDFEFKNTRGYYKIVGTRDYTLRDAIKAVVNSNPEQKPLTSEEQAKRNEIILKVMRAKKGMVYFTPKQVALLQELSPKVLTPIFDAQVQELLEGSINPFLVNPTESTEEKEETGKESE